MGKPVMHKSISNVHAFALPPRGADFYLTDHNIDFAIVTSYMLKSLTYESCSIQDFQNDVICKIMLGVHVQKPLAMRFVGVGGRIVANLEAMSTLNIQVL